jgi:addiction module HigA family antidote
MTYSHPGKTLQDQYLKPNGLSQNQLARALGVPPRRINEIILGKRAVTADTAVRLGYYFGNSAGYWMHLQAEYEIERARTKIGMQLHNIRAPHHDEQTLGAKPVNTGEHHAPNTAPTGGPNIRGNIRANIRRRMMR